MSTTHNQNSTVIAYSYVVANGQHRHELVEIPGGHIVSVDGHVRDARQRLTLREAREWWDRAAYRPGPRPGTCRQWHSGNKELHATTRGMLECAGCGQLYPQGGAQ